MIETLLVFVLVGLLVGLGSAASLVPPLTLLAAGGALLAVGFIGGGAAGAYYHVLLHRALKEAGEVPRGWYWNPTSHHQRVSPEARRGFRVWFLIGAAGFGMIILACMVIMLASMVM